MCIREAGSQSFEIIEVKDVRIVCFTVPNEVLVTRRHGKVAIHGNTKHAMHLLRLLRMGEEILREGVVRVLRPDAEWLLAVRNGALTYDEVLTYAAEHKARLAATIAHSPLPEEPDEQAADRLLIELQSEYLFGGVERVRRKATLSGQVITGDNEATQDET